ncbi:hypothetical protein HU200_005187 [Digitaria exilis]|uniref:HARP domain-containing protein n=1 Tax=Digitaria exilis TaxID=1010633 RepID=A0A835FTP2_9POAL|nr:hypothetical protein HU200_005187 [Digitaria exilis]
MAAHGAGGGWGYGDDDDWGLSAEQLDQIERDAIRQLAERKASSAAASTARSPASALGAISPLPSRATAPAAAATSPFGANHPAARASLEARFGKVRVPPLVRYSVSFIKPSVFCSVLPLFKNRGVLVEELIGVAIEAVSPSRPYDPNTSRNAVNNSQGSSPKISVHISLHSSGVIAAKFPYNQLLVDAFHKIPKASWNAKERVWMFPPSSLSIAEEVLGSVPGLAVEVRKLDPLVQRALLASLSTKDLRAADLIFLGEDYMTGFLLMLSPSLCRFSEKASGIAVASCLHDAWPVLVICPSSLRLHGHLSKLDTLLYNRRFRTGSTSHGRYLATFLLSLSLYVKWCCHTLEDHIRQDSDWFIQTLKEIFVLDGVFNVISYDVVPKIQSTLLDLDFKVENLKLNMLYLLSGTPALSRPIELFTQVPAIVKSCIDLMKATVKIRRLKKDVLTQLPFKRRTTGLLDLSEKDVKPVALYS